jgi:hypothetical protein
MKRSLLTSISLLAAAVMLSRCGSSTTSPSSGASCGTVSTAKGTMSAQLDGSSWEAAAVTTSLKNTNLVSIGGADACSPGRVVTFSLVVGGVGGALQKGTFTIGPSDLTGLTSLLDIGPINIWGANVSLGGSGTVTFTTLSQTSAVGTFQFSYLPQTISGASGTHSVTNGVFNVTF